MKGLSLIRFWLISLVYAVRRTIPLYMNDHARIASLYAWSLLNLFQTPQSSMKSKLKYINKFSNNFSLPISIGRLAETLYADPRATEFNTYYQSLLAQGKISPNTARVYSRAQLALTRIPQDSIINTQSFSERLARPLRPDLKVEFAKFSSVKNADAKHLNFRLTSQYTPQNKAHALLILPLGTLDDAPLHALSFFNHITVMPQSAYDAASLTQQLEKAIGRKTKISFYEPTARHAAPYSEGNVYISGFCDDLAKQILNAAFKKRSIRRFIPDTLDDDVSLMVSDIIYRPVQSFYAALRAIETHKDVSDVFYLGPATSLPRTIARSTERSVYIVTHGTSVETDEEVTSYSEQRPSLRQLKKDIRRTLVYLSARTLKAAPPIQSSAEPHIYFATNSWSRSYAKAGKLITEKLASIAPVSIFDYAAPVGLQQNIQASVTPCLHNALLSTRSSDIILISQYIGLVDMVEPEKIALGHFQATEMKSLIIHALEKELGAIIGNILLYRSIVKALLAAPNTILVQCPGRFGNIRCLGKAFQKAERPTLDVQALFVTEMARYKAPMADKMTVIDSFAQDLYMAQWNLSKDLILPIGSILLDDDIKESQSGDAKALKAKLLNGHQKTVITYASQPLPDREVMKAVEALAQYMKSKKDTHLCVKLHPTQDDVTQTKIEQILNAHLLDRTSFTVLKTTPFSSVMPFTDLLISYFSNVCLMAPSFKTPVITLPTTVPIPAITLADMGLAHYVKEFADLDATINQVLSETPENIHKSYIAKNPHMTQLTALDSLANIVKQSLTEALHSEA